MANILALIVFLRKSFRVKKSTYFILSMTVADLQVGVACILIFANNMQHSAQIWINFALLASLFSLVGIAVERTYAVFFPFKHRLSKTSSYLLWITLVETLAFCRGIYPLYLFFNGKTVKYYTMYMICSDVSGYTVSLAIIVTCYISIWIKMRFGKTFDNEQASRKSASLAKTLSIVTITSVGCFLIPMVIYINLEPYEYWHYNILADVLLLSNSFWNVLVYSIRMPEFGKELRGILRGFAFCIPYKVEVCPYHPRQQIQPCPPVIGGSLSRDEHAVDSPMSRETVHHISRDQSCVIHSSVENDKCFDRVL
ncbi:predicted protein [Nematostella vectensis]|uniref:G-protein coupled receptors family 1 profile domain-containing protein n=1 Tax=Nematostella vectensis TaxID=45351 RepID=A7SDN1_NEMVE|nr:predicted protein [Nematostella vectensis]|eukprot:XP_001630273.1 predicted protein [Nematostella vectensis]